MGSGRGGSRVHAAVASTRLGESSGSEVSTGGGKGWINVFLLETARRMISRDKLRVCDSARQPRRTTSNVRLEKTECLSNTSNFLMWVHSGGTAME